MGKSDANAMYSNIDPEEGINSISSYIDLFAEEYTFLFPKTLIIKLLKMVMTKNVLKFGDTWRKQEIGIAIGKPYACLYATIFSHF